MAAAVLGLAAPTPLAQTPAAIQAALDAAHVKHKELAEGKNADYIPALAKVDPKIYGIVLVTRDGEVYTAGDVKSEVSIQSINGGKNPVTGRQVMKPSNVPGVLAVMATAGLYDDDRCQHSGMAACLPAGDHGPSGPGRRPPSPNSKCAHDLRPPAGGARPWHLAC